MTGKVHSLNCEGMGADFQYPQDTVLDIRSDTAVCAFPDVGGEAIVVDNTPNKNSRHFVTAALFFDGDYW